MPAQIDVGAVIRRVLAIYVDQASLLMPAAAVVFVITGVLSLVLDSGGVELERLAALISLAAMLVFAGMVVGLVADLRHGRRHSSAGQLLRAVGPAFWPLFGTTLLAALAILAVISLCALAFAFALVLGLMAALIPCIVLLTFWCLLVPVAVIERPGVFKTLPRSRSLVRGNAWRVFSVMLALDVVPILAGLLLLTIAFTVGTGLGLVVWVIVGILAVPLPALASAVLYFELLGG